MVWDCHTQQIPAPSMQNAPQVFTWGRETASSKISLKDALGVGRFLELQSVSGPPLHRTRTAAITDIGHLAATIKREGPQSRASVSTVTYFCWAEHSMELRLPFSAEPVNFEQRGKRRKWGKCEALSSGIRDSVKHLSEHLASRQCPTKAQLNTFAGGLRFSKTLMLSISHCISLKLTTLRNAIWLLLLFCHLLQHTVAPNLASARLTDIIINSPCKNHSIPNHFEQH